MRQADLRIASLRGNGGQDEGCISESAPATSPAGHAWSAQWQAEYVIIGVGGFLGIGEKDVAVPYGQVKFTDQPMTPPMNTAPNNTMRGVDTPPDAPATALGMPANSGTVGAPAGTAAPAVAEMSRSTANPDHGMIDMTFDQLKSAPTFHFGR